MISGLKLNSKVCICLVSQTTESVLLRQSLSFFNQKSFTIKKIKMKIFKDSFRLTLFITSLSFLNLFAQTETPLNLTSREIIGKEMVYEFNIFSVDLIISSDSTLSWRDLKNNKNNYENEKTKTIHLNDYSTLVSWVEADSTFVTMYSDFRKGESSAFLYTKTGRTIPVIGTIKQKEKD